jgi:hypothetical protein
MDYTIQTAVAVGVPLVGVVVWLVRLEGRINTNEALQTQMRDDVRYIKERIDRVLGR